MISFFAGYTDSGILHFIISLYLFFFFHNLQIKEKSIDLFVYELFSGCSIVVMPQLPKLVRRVRFPSPAPVL